MEDSVVSIVTGLGIRAPVCIFCLAGIAMAAIRWQRHPKVSLWVEVGLFLIFMSFTGSAIVFGVLGQIIAATQVRPDIAYQGVAFCSITLDALGMTFLLVAAFVERTSRAT